MAASSDERSLLESYPWLYGVGAGVATFLAEYLVVALIFLAPGRPSANAGDPATALARYGQVLYNGHNVPTRTMVQNATITKSVNPLYGPSDPAIPVVVYFLIPVVGLLVAGAVLGHRRHIEPSFSLPKVAADQAGEIALGYVLAGLVGAFLFVSVGQETVQTTSGRRVAVAVTRHPDRILTLLLFLFYPIVLGWIGAFTAMWRRRKQADSSGDDRRRGE